MAFIAGTTSFNRYRIVEEVPADLWSRIPDLLQKHAIKDIDQGAEERSWGWTCFDDWLDTEWRTAPPEKGAYITFSLRLDTRRVPAAVFKKHFQLALREAERDAKEQGRKGLSRDQKREIKDQVTFRLRTRTLPIPAEFNVVWNTETGIIWFDSTRDKVCELFMEHFSETFDLHLEPLTPYFLALHLAGLEAHARIDAIEASRFA